MKYLYSFVVLLLLHTAGFGQSLPIDFESVVMAGDFVTFGTTVTDDANPDNSGINPSANVARIIKTGGNGGCYIDLATPLDFTANGDQLCIKVYSESTNPTVILFKLEGSGNTERAMTWTPSSDWQEMCFDFSGDFAPYNRITLFFGFNSTAAQNFLFDDIVHPPRLDGNELALPIDFEGLDNAGYPISDDNFGIIDGGFMGGNGFSNGVATIEGNTPSIGNPSNTVGKIVRHLGSTNAGAYIDLPEALVLDLDPILCMNVFTEAGEGTEIILRIEDSNNSSIFMEDTALTTVSGGWDTLCFVFHNAPLTCDRLTFLFDLGNPGDGTNTSTFLFDDIYQPLTPSSSSFFFTPGSQFFCPPYSFTLIYPGTGEYNWYDDPEGTNLVGTGPTFTTPVLNGSTSFFVQDTTTTPLGEALYGPSQAVLGGPTGTPNTVSTFFTSNINGEFRSVKMRQVVIGGPPSCNYTVASFNLSTGASRSLNWNAAPPADGAVYTYNFPTPLPISSGDLIELRITSLASGCHVQASTSGDNVLFLPFAVNGSHDPEITFTGHTTNGVADQRMSGMDYRIFGAYMDPTLYQVNAIADCINPLPIELLNFSVREDNGRALITWSTASEINNEKFHILRTVDGLNFETIGTVDGAGNSTSVLHYSYKDYFPKEGVSYYQLLQVDYDGAESRSDLVSFVNGSSEEFILFPNPTFQDLTLSLNEEYDHIDVLVYDLTGRLITRKTFNSIDVVNFKLEGNPGTYFVEIVANDERKAMFNVLKL